MTALARLLIGGGLAFALLTPAFADEPKAAPAPTETSIADTAAQAKAAERERLMTEVVCRNLDEDDTGSHVRHRTCKKRSEWAVYDKAQKPGYDPDTGKAVVKY